MGRVLMLAGLVAVVISAAAASDPAIPTSKLALMVLPKAELGSAAAPLKYDASSSGVYGNAQAADDSIDPNATAASLARAGRLTGYELFYGNRKLEIGTEVDLFRDSVGVSADLAKRLRDLRRFEGRVVNGVKLERVQTFAVPKLGDEVLAVRLTAARGGNRIWGTGIRFRLGALEGSVDVVRADAADASAQTIRLALALEHRMRGVLAGGRPLVELAFVPVDHPPAARPHGIPDLARAVLSRADLPRRAMITTSAYDRDTAGSRAAFERDFDLYRSRSWLLELEDQVFFDVSALDASVGYAGSEGFLDGQVLALVRNFFVGRGLDVQVTSVTHVRSRDLRSGDEAHEVTVLMGTPVGRFPVAEIDVRVGRLTSHVWAIGIPGGRITAPQIDQLARRMVERMRPLSAPHHSS
jgi:hypothetical protein